MYKELTNFCSENNIKLVVVTKTRQEDTILEFYHQGHRIFGENRVQELTEKHQNMPKDIEWHMIGHLQSNKVKYIASFVSMIHSGANYSLLKEINKRAKSSDRIIDVLLQLKIGKEDTKSGWDETELKEYLAENRLQEFENIRFCGVMGMATFTDDKAVVRLEFATLKRIYDQLKQEYFSDSSSFDTISMGMSGDYQIAVEEGATMIRIGSLLYT